MLPSESIRCQFERVPALVLLQLSSPPAGARNPSCALQMDNFSRLSIHHNASHQGLSSQGWINQHLCHLMISLHTYFQWRLDLLFVPVKVNHDFLPRDLKLQISLSNHFCDIKSKWQIRGLHSFFWALFQTTHYYSPYPLNQLAGIKPYTSESLWLTNWTRAALIVSDMSILICQCFSPLDKKSSKEKKK